MTRRDLDAIRARCDAATPGPWHVEGDAGWWRVYSTSSDVKIFDDGSCGEEYAQVISLEDRDFLVAARIDIPALLAYVEELEAARAMLLHREVMLKRAHGALADAGSVVPIELDRTIEHAIHALAERALTAEERLEQRTRERDEARAQLAALGTGSPCDGHRHCCADRRRLADELVRVRAERDEAVHACADALAERITWYQRGREEALKEKP